MRITVYRKAISLILTSQPVEPNILSLARDSANAREQHQLVRPHLGFCRSISVGSYTTTAHNRKGVETYSRIRTHIFHYLPSDEVQNGENGCEEHEGMAVTISKLGTYKLWIQQRQSTKNIQHTKIERGQQTLHGKDTSNLAFNG